MNSVNINSSAAATKSGKVIFVGNIPYDMSEEQLIEIFKQVGPLVTFRLVFDRETGRAKGYGFCEYCDAETAASAIRNLNNYDVGNRQLRVDYAESDTLPAPKDKQLAGTNASSSSSAVAASQIHTQAQMFGSSNIGLGNVTAFPSGIPLSPLLHSNNNSVNNSNNNAAVSSFMYLNDFAQNVLPAAASVSAGKSTTDAITAVLAAMSSEQILVVLGHLKALVLSEPENARTLLTANPQLSYAVFQALLMMGLVDEGIVQNVVLKNANANANSNPNSITNTNTNIPSPPSVANGNNANSLEEQKQLLMQIMSLTDEQIAALPAEQREQILFLKSQIPM